jgi:hypothetical protein
MPATYPTASDLERFLIATGIVSTTPQSPFTFLDLAQSVQTAKTSFEGRIGRVILAGASLPRTYDPPQFPRPILLLRAELAAFTSLTVGGVVKNLNTDFFLKPENADQIGHPWNAIEFVVPVYAARRSIVVTGQWGYGLTVTDQFWDAILCRSAHICYPHLAAAYSKGLVSWKEDDTSENYGEVPFQYLQKQWDEVYEDTVSNNLNTTVYL